MYCKYRIIQSITSKLYRNMNRIMTESIVTPLEELQDFLSWAPSARKTVKTPTVSFRWKQYFPHCANTGLSGPQYELITILLGLWPIFITPYFWAKTMLNPISQSVSQSINQSINQSVSQSVSQSTSLRYKLPWLNTQCQIIKEIFPGSTFAHFHGPEIKLSPLC